MEEGWFEFLTTTIAGLAHHVSRGYVTTNVVVGAELSLVREPGNRHDRNAIRVEDGEELLGYIPRTQAMALAAMMDHGYEVRCVVEGVHPQHHDVSITLLMRDLRANPVRGAQR